MRKLTVVLSMLVLLMASNAMALGPLLVFDPPTSTPYAYAGPVALYTDNDASFSLTGPVSNADADARVADAAAQWAGVATSTLSIAVAGDFASIGLPDINLGNWPLVLSTDNGGGYHVVYDHDGSIIANLAGPGVLGFSSPEWAVGGTPDIYESYAVLNGSTVDPGDTQALWWQGVFTHEMGHGINLAHVQLNGAVGFFGDAGGPGGCALPYGGGPTINQLETMYPFIDPTFLTGSGVAQGTVDMLDDRASVSDIYPEATWPASHATIDGTIYLPDAATEVTGVNVIVRNLADPFGDCSSMLSGAFSQGDAGPDGSYAFHGLTPGQTYVVYVDEIVAGGFSTPPVALPGPEEFYNGGSESGDSDIDDKCDYTGIVAGLAPTTADIIFNFELIFGDDTALEVPLPFTFNLCGDDYDSVWIGSNGFVTFGVPNTDFSESVADLLAGPARIAVLWDDLDPSAGGSITAEQVGADFVITWDGVPEFAAANSNTFSLTLRPDNTFNMDYPGFDLLDALVGRARGNGLSANPGEVDLSAASEPITGATGDAVYELFAGDADLSGDNLDWDACEGDVVVITPATMGVIYATSGAADAGNLYTIDPTTGAATLIGPMGIGGVPGLAINSSGEIWGAQRVTGDLYRIDAATGQAFFQTATPGVDYLDAIAFNSSDVLYGIGFDPPSFQLRTINTSTGVSTPLGATNDVYVGMAFHPTTGVLYASVGGFQPVNPDGIATLNTGNGAATILGATGLGGATPDLVFDVLGNMYGVKGGGQSGNSNFISVSTGNGAGAVVGPTGYPAMSGMASWIESVVPTLLQAFDAEAGENEVVLQWRVHTTGDDLVGFRVHRREGDEMFRVIHESFEPSMRDFSDATVVGGKSYVYKLEVMDADRSFFSQELEVRANVLALELTQNHPNPFNPTTTIGYTVPVRSKVSLQIYDVTGRFVASLVDESLAAGRHSDVWNGRSATGEQVGSGVYFYRLNVGNDTLTRKMVLLK